MIGEDHANLYDERHVLGASALVAHLDKWSCDLKPRFEGENERVFQITIKMEMEWRNKKR